MLTSLLLGAALSTPAAPIPKNADAAPAGPAPWMVHLKADANGNVQLLLFRMQKYSQAQSVLETVNGKATRKIVRQQVERMGQIYVSLKASNPKCTTAAGVEVPLDSVIAKAKDGVLAFISADGKPVSKCWLRTMDPDAVVLASDGLVSAAAPRSFMLINVSSMAPRLAMLGAGADGKVQIPYNPTIDSSNNSNIYFARGGRVAFVNNGFGVQQVFYNDAMNQSMPNPSLAVAPLKPLEKLKFDAYDLTGKRIDRAVALKQLQAGGLALIASDDSAPDLSYLKAYRGDLLVLASPELVNVPTGTKAKGGAPALVVRPNAPAPVLLPAVAAPAARILVRPALRVAPLAPPPAPPPAEKKK